MRQRITQSEASRTKRDQRRTGIRETDDNVKAYLESAPDGVYVIDLNGTFLFGNKKAEEIVGYAREELLGKSFLKLKLLPPKHLMKAAKLLALNSMGKETGPDEFEMIRKDGGRRWVEITGAPINQNGKRVVLGFVRDISERKKAKEIEEQYAYDQMLLSKAAIELANLSSNDNIYTFVAERLKKLVGDCTVIVNSFSEESGSFTIQSVVGVGRQINALAGILRKRPAGMTITATPISDQVKSEISSGKLTKVPGGVYELSFGALPKHVCHAIEKLLSIGDTYAIGFSWEGALYGSAAIFMHQGSILRNPHTVEVLVNQTAIALQRRQAEEQLRQAHSELEMRVKERTAELEKANESIRESENRYRLIADNTADFIIITTFEGVYSYISPSHKRLGYTESDLLGKNALQLMHPADRKRLLPLLTKYAGMKIKELLGLKKESFSETVSYRFPDKWGNWHYFESTGTIVDAIDGKGLNILFVTRDITERKQTEDTLRFLTAQTERMSAISTLAAGVAHELNNPMMGILNFIQYCLKHTSEDDLRYPVLQDSERETKRCADIVKNLMSFSPSVKEGEVEYEKQSLATIIDRVIKLLSCRVHEKHITITCHVAEELPEIWMKTDAIQQVVLNIVDNALDALVGCPKKEIYIEAQPEGEFAQILFCDSGCGIAPEALGRIFEPFFTTKPVGKGTGLGLSVGRNIVNEHGGSITCESTLGVGTTFKVLLPIHGGRKEEKTR